jgi:hypothetical protein
MELRIQKMGTWKLGVLLFLHVRVQLKEKQMSNCFAPLHGGARFYPIWCTLDTMRLQWLCLGNLLLKRKRCHKKMGRVCNNEKVLFFYLRFVVG